MTPLLDYRFDEISVASPDGMFPLRFEGATVVEGPGSTQLGTLRKALDLGGAGKAAVSLQGLNPDLRQFCIRIVAQANGEVTGRQNLVESSRIPFALFLDKGEQPGTFDVSTPFEGLSALADNVLVVGGALSRGGSAPATGAGRILADIGAPTDRVSGNVGDLFQRLDGGAGPKLFVKESGNGTTDGWTPK
jgi:hypothetical protein